MVHGSNLVSVKFGYQNDPRIPETLCAQGVTKSFEEVEKEGKTIIEEINLIVSSPNACDILPKDLKGL